MKALVTGGSGFLGGKLIHDLHEKGWDVYSYSRSQPKNLPETTTIHLGDLSNLEKLKQACKGIDCVFHTAAIAGVWGPRELYFETNVTGTENVIQACHAQKVPRLVYTSSPSVIFDGVSHKNATEKDSPYPKNWLCHYPESKAIGEQKVLAENGKDGLSTLSLRPHLIFGPGDPHLIPRILEKAKKGRLKIVGDGLNWVDMIHVNNASHAHILAEQALCEGRAGGEAFFISNDAPIQMWPWIQDLLKAAQLPAIKGQVSASTAAKAGSFLEWVYGTLGIKSEPPMTRFVAKQLSTDHSYNLDKAKKLLGYSPIISMEDATKELHLEHNA